MATVDYGFAMSCTDELHTGRYVRGAILVGEECYRRITTTRGTLWGFGDEQNYGINLPRLIGTLADSGVSAALPGIIESELLKDERVETVECSVVETRAGLSITYTISIEVTTGMGPFELVITADKVSASLLSLTEPA